MTYEILKGVVGSKAYGLDHAGSDTDYMSVYITPTLDLVGFDPPPRDSIRGSNPDSIAYELGKFLLLTAKASVTTSEFLWLDSYETCTSEGSWLLDDVREALLSQRAKASYTGYAVGEFKAISKYNTEYDDRAKFVKKAVTAFRLLEQFHTLWQTGTLQPRVEDPNSMRAAATDFIDQPPETRAERALMYINGADRTAEKPTPLPAEPNHAVIRDYLHEIRKQHVNPSHTTHRI